MSHKLKTQIGQYVKLFPAGRNRVNRWKGPDIGMCGRNNGYSGGGCSVPEEVTGSMEG